MTMRQLNDEPENASVTFGRDQLTFRKGFGRSWSAKLTVKQNNSGGLELGDWRLTYWLRSLNRHQLDQLVVVLQENVSGSYSGDITTAFTTERHQLLMVTPFP